MRDTVNLALTRGRVTSGRFRSAASDGLQGMFYVLGPVGRLLKIVSSDGRGWSLTGLPAPAWEHVSVSLERLDRTPTWQEMAWVKDLFWGPQEAVVEFHVPSTDHVNFHPGCLHLWKPIGVELPRPPAECVGPLDRLEVEPACHRPIGLLGDVQGPGADPDTR